jgi:hypothetical protein
LENVDQSELIAEIVAVASRPLFTIKKIPGPEILTGQDN